jgi:V/A-type H+-transporting ATPase subunit E
MSVNGLQRITDKILADAQARADLILDQARQESERITAEYAAAADALRRKLSLEAESEAKAFIEKTKASATAQKNELLLSQKSKLVDRVFENAFEEALALGTQKYAELVGGLVASAVYDFCRSEAENRECYGEEEDEQYTFEIVLNKKDRDTCADELLSAARRRLGGKVPAESLDGMTVSRQVRRIRGGAIVCYGPVECNCSLEMVFAQLRRELEGEVCATLFDFRGNGI